MVNRQRFTALPHHDSEGFTVMDAKCRGCDVDEACPRSGHCENYDSPLRMNYQCVENRFAAADMLLYGPKRVYVDPYDIRAKGDTMRAVFRGITHWDEFSEYDGQEEAKLAIAAMLLDGDI